MKLTLTFDAEYPTFFHLTELQCTFACDEKELVIDYEIRGKFKVSTKIILIIE